MSRVPEVRRSANTAGIKPAGTKPGRTAALVALALPLLVLPVVSQGAESLEDLLTQVGEEYAIAYSSPFLYAFGPSMNSGMYHTADIPLAGLNIGVNIRAMAARLHQDDQSFRRVMAVDDLHVYDSTIPEGTSGTIVMQGPTIFGNTDAEGTITGYVNGVPVFEDETIAGLVDTRFVPMVTPEFALGSVYGLKAVVRWLPTVDIDDYGDFKYLGYGLQWNAGQILQNLPVDLLVGFAKQKLEVGTLVETNASSFFAAVSKQYSILTGYAGFALESSDMTVAYEYEHEDPDNPGTQITDAISFEVDGIQDSRLTVGATVNLGLKLTAEVAHGKMTTFSGGLIMGF